MDYILPIPWLRIWSVSCPSLVSIDMDYVLSWSTAFVQQQGDKVKADKKMHYNSEERTDKNVYYSGKVRTNKVKGYKWMVKQS